MDKLSMSLDDIIKNNRRGPRNQGRNGNNQPKNKVRRQNQNPALKNKLGILNQSKRIGKNNRIKRNNSSFLQRNRPNLKKSDKLAKLKSRLSLGKPIGQQGLKKARPNLATRRPINSGARKRLQQPKRDNNNNTAMKIAKKNVEKAKRVLANRISKVKQIAANINKKKPMPKRQNTKIKRLGNKPRAPRFNAFNKTKISRPKVGGGRNANRTNNRKVFY